MSEGSNSNASNENGVEPFDFSWSNSEIRSSLFKSAFWSIASGAGGVTTAYIEGQALFFPMYFFTGLGFCYSSTFFGTSLAVKHFRKNHDDVYNHAIGGAISFTTVGTIFHGIRRGAKTGVVGAGLGAAFYYGGNWLYDNTRKNWLEFRRHVIHRTETKTVSKPVYNKSMTLQIGKRDERLPPLPVVPNSDASKVISYKGNSDETSLEKSP